MIHRWDIITLGNLSRNRYWGEGDEAGRRPPLCTCTLVRAEGYNLLVDPSISDAERMTAELDRRTGLTPGQIDLVFLTHAHGDHHFGLRHFPASRWLAAPQVAAAINHDGGYAKKVEGIENQIEKEIDILHTPGHTLEHYSLRFDCQGYRVVIAADAAMNRDFWNDRRGYFNTEDPQAAVASMERLARLADIIVPGHDNYYLVNR